MNVEGMLPWENLVADYVEETGNHVLYRVTPYFAGTELVARGVQMEAMSVEDAVRACILTSMPTTFSLTSALITPPGTTGRKNRGPLNGGALAAV